jgi:pyrroloquinoline-quinone synthase
VKTCRYFTLHKTADVHHASVWRGLIDERLACDPSKADAALNGAETAAAALWNALDGIERARLAKRAA